MRYLAKVLDKICRLCPMRLKWIILGMNNFSYTMVYLHPSMTLNNEKNCREINKDKIEVCKKTAGLRCRNSSDLNSACVQSVSSCENILVLRHAQRKSLSRHSSRSQHRLRKSIHTCTLCILCLINTCIVRIQPFPLPKLYLIYIYIYTYTYISQSLLTLKITNFKNIGSSFASG